MLTSYPFLGMVAKKEGQVEMVLSTLSSGSTCF